MSTVYIDSTLSSGIDRTIFFFTENTSVITLATFHLSYFIISKVTNTIFNAHKINFFHFGKLTSLQSIVLYVVNLVKTLYLFTAVERSKDTMDYTFA